MMFRLIAGFLRRGVLITRAQGVKVILATLALMAYSTSGFLYFEISRDPELDWNDAVWWAVVTMTTVGYGDHFPTTPGGRFAVGLPTMLFGISVLGYVLSTVATLLIESKSKEIRGMNAMNLSDHIVLVNHPSLAHVQTLIRDIRADESMRSRPIVLLDENLEQLPPALQAEGIRFVRGLPTHEEVLRQASIATASHAIVLSADPASSHSDSFNLVIVLTIEKINPDVFTIVECVDPANVVHLERTGCNSIVCASRFSSNLIIQELVDPGVQDVVEAMTRSFPGHHQIFVTPIRHLARNSFGELRSWLAHHGCLVLGVKRAGDVIFDPAPEFAVEVTDRVVTLGVRRPPAVSIDPV